MRDLILFIMTGYPSIYASCTGHLHVYNYM